MKKQKSQAWIKVFHEINAYMESNLDKWNTIDEIRRTYDEFISNFKKLKDLQPELEKDLNPVEEDLADKREILHRKLFPVSNVFEVYAVDHPVGKKGKAVLVARKRLESYKNKDFLKHITRVHKLLNKYMHQDETELDDKKEIQAGPDIKNYGLSQAMLDELYTAGHEFQSARKLHTDVINYRKTVRQRSDELIRTNRTLLKNRLNKLMTVFSGTHPSFYKEYSSISKIK
ncbi:MAG: hypothetical protein KAT15_23375 [Bacteroidales bacterium]|nr:hypothetical protein [Bacteroidales bacterium]